MSGSTSSSAYAGDTLTLPAAPTKKGSKFSCWEIDGKKYAPYDVLVMPDHNLQVNAVWAKYVKISFNFAGGEGTAPNYNDKVKGDTIVLPGAPRLADHVFSGWFDGTSTWPANSRYTLSGDVTFVAKYTSSLSDGNPAISLRDALVYEKMNMSDIVTVSGYTASIHDQLDMQITVFIQGLYARFNKIWGNGYIQNSYAAIIEDFITERYMSGGNPTLAKFEQSSDFYTGCIRVKGRELSKNAPRYSEYTYNYEQLTYDEYGIHITSDSVFNNHCNDYRDRANINCVNCYDLVLRQRGEFTYGYSNTLSRSLYLNGAIIGPDAYINIPNGDENKYRSEAWNWGLSKSVSYSKYMENYFDAGIQAIANILAYGEDKGVDYETALQDISHLGFTEQDEKNITDFVINTIVGRSQVALDDSRRPIVPDDVITVDLLPTLSDDNHKYKAYSLLLPCVVHMSVTPEIFDYSAMRELGEPVWQYKSLYTVKYINTNDASGNYNTFVVVKPSEALKIREIGFAFNMRTEANETVEITFVNGNSKYTRIFDLTPDTNSVVVNFSEYQNGYFQLSQYNGFNEEVSTAPNGDINISNLGSSYIIIKMKYGGSTVNITNLILQN